jgi:hypothetical protein
LQADWDSLTQESFQYLEQYEAEHQDHASDGHSEAKDIQASVEGAITRLPSFPALS